MPMAKAVRVWGCLQGTKNVNSFTGNRKEILTLMGPLGKGSQQWVLFFVFLFELAN